MTLANTRAGAIWLGILVWSALASWGWAATIRLQNTYHEDHRATPRLLFPDAGMSVLLPPVDFLKANHSLFGLPPDLANLEVARVRHSLVGVHTRYRQVLNGVPVEGGEIIVSRRQSDQAIYQVYNNTYPVDHPVPPPGALIGRDEALSKAWDFLHVHGRLKAMPRAELVYMPVKSEFRLVYKTLLAVDAPRGYWEQKVDALTGDIIAVRRHEVSLKRAPDPIPDFAAYPGPVTPFAPELARLRAESAAAATPSSRATMVDGTALVFDPDPRTALAASTLVDGSSATTFNPAYLQKPLLQISLDAGVYRLEGPYVKIVNMPTELPATPVSTSASGNWTAKRGNNAFNDVMCYYHIDQNQRYIQSLGFTNAAAIQAAPITVDSDGVDGDDNSHYIPSMNSLAFGHGGVDDDEDADVILHEYGHAITFDIASNWDGGDTGAIGEGFGDYWGASHSWTSSNGPAFHPAWAFSWDGHSADSWPGRFLDMTQLVYDHSHTYYDHETIDGIANYSDQLWGTPIFQAFLDLIQLERPRSDMDKIILESFFGIGTGVKMRDMANATVRAAQELFPGGPHAEVYFTRFLNQRILANYQMPDPVILHPAGGEVFPTNMAIRIQWSLNGAPSKAATCIEYTPRLNGGGVMFSDRAETGTNGWTRRRSGGADWAITTTASHSPTRSWFANEESYTGERSLISPPFTVGQAAELTFWHWYALEPSYDGGVVEISTDGTQWADLGLSAVENGYNYTISSATENPIGGRKAFSGSSGGFIRTRIPLSAYAGQTVQLRFREADDFSLKNQGWWVDDIEVSVGPTWIPIATTPTNTVEYDWNRPEMPGTNVAIRMKLVGSNCTDSAWVVSGSFTLQGESAPIDIALSRSLVPENEPAGTIVGTFSTDDPDGDTAFTYAMAPGDGSGDNDAFAIQGSTLVTAIPFNYEVRSQYTVRIRTTDDDGRFFEKAFAIAVSNIPGEYALTVSTANGTVTKTPDLALYEEGATVSLLASPNTGYHFAGWGGDAVGMDNPLTVAMDGHKSVAGNFVLNVITVLTDRAAVAIPEGGSATFQVRISAQPTGSVGVAAAWIAGDPDIRVAGTTNLTFTTANWDGFQTFTLAAAEDNGENLPGEAEIGIGGRGLVPATVTATEIDDDFTLTITAEHGTVTRTPDAAVYDRGTVVSLRPYPGAGYYFGGWSGSAKGMFVPVSVAMTNDASVTATFVMNAVSVLVDRAAVSIPEGGSTNIQVKLSAQPTGDTVVVVARMSGDSDVGVAAGSNLIFSTVNWAAWRSVTLMAAEDDGDNEKGTATLACRAPGIADGVLVATEADDDFRLVVTSRYGTVAMVPAMPFYERGSVVAMTATPGAQYYFKGWEGDLVGTNNPGNVVMDGDKAVTAVYGPVAPVVLPPSRVVKNSFTARWQWTEGAAPEGELEVALDAAFLSPVWGYNPRFVANVTECPVTSLYPGADYWYRVRRVLPDGQVGPWSGRMKVKTITGIATFKNLLPGVPVSRGVTQEIPLTNLVAGTGTLKVKSSNANAVKATVTPKALVLQYLWKGATTAKITLTLSHASGYKATHAAVLTRAGGTVAVVSAGALTNAATRVAQEVVLENQTGATMYGVRIRVKGLENNAWLVNRTGVDPVTKAPVVEIPCVLPAGSQAVVRLVFNKAYAAQAATRPAAVTAWAVIPGGGAAPACAEMAVSRQDLFDGLPLLAMPANRNRLYAVLHSDDGGATWVENGPRIRATANYLMWLDGDEDAPAGRLYRVVDAGL